EDVYKLLAENPKVIERPIVIENGKAIVCRPPEKVLAFFK
ncbi:MAG: ArsC/Spx/MgsR family protein, partial [Bacteroidales bacterium]